jgi:uncharacterized protein YqeY
MSLRHRLRDDLAQARKSRDNDLASLLRTLITAIENAEAVDTSQAGGATEVPRRDLSNDDIEAILRHEAADLRQAADHHAQLGNEEEAARLRSLSEVPDRYADAVD